MKTLTRRQFIQVSAGASAALAATGLAQQEQTSALAKRKMTICLSCGSIGVSANQREAIDLAARHGFESVEANGDFLAGLDDAQQKDLADEMKVKGLVFGHAGLPVDFRRDDARFTESLKRLPRIATGLERAGVTRVTTWLSPCDNSRSYLQNFKMHAQRLRDTALILKDHGLRLGLEYVGTKTSRERCRYSFIHTMADLKDLIAEIGTGNVGMVLDSWHWWQADDTIADIQSLTNADIVAADLNDAPAGVPKERQLDGRRELPAATGVIDVDGFLKAMNQVGFDGPVRAEPFNKALNDLGNEEACAATAAAMKKAFAMT
ncbi:MAG: sugar phosphate isomerase/epimerase family protein [Verrucomicrobiia bacterium]